MIITSDARGKGPSLPGEVAETEIGELNEINLTNQVTESLHQGEKNGEECIELIPELSEACSTTYTIEDMSEELRNLLISSRMEKITDKLLEKRVFGFITLYCLTDADLDDIRKGLKPVEVKRFDREIAKLIIDQRAILPDSEQIIKEPQEVSAEESARQLVEHFFSKSKSRNNDDTSVPMEIDPPVLAEEDDTEANDDEAEEVEAPSSEAGWTREQIELQIEEAKKCADILNCIIVQDEENSEYLYCNIDISSAAIERLQTSKEMHIDRLRYLQACLATASSGGAVSIAPAIKSSKKKKKNVRFTADTRDPTHAAYKKDEEFARKLHDEENLKLLRQKEKQRFMNLQTEQDKRISTWTCRLCQQTNPEHLYSCKDCSTSRSSGWGGHFQKNTKRNSTREHPRNPNHYTQRHAKKIDRDMEYYGGGYQHNYGRRSAYNHSTQGVYVGDNISSKRNGATRAAVATSTYSNHYAADRGMDSDDDEPGMLSSMISGVKSFFGGCSEDSSSTHAAASPPSTYHTSYRDVAVRAEPIRRELHYPKSDTPMHSMHTGYSPKSTIREHHVQGSWVNGPPSANNGSNGTSSPLHSTVKCQREAKTVLHGASNVSLNEHYFKGASAHDISIL